jgi:hypothetical protein
MNRHVESFIFQIPAPPASRGEADYRVKLGDGSRAAQIRLP